jgi:hypothetical protein
MAAGPRRIVVDSGPLIALFDASDAHHARALDFVKHARAQLLTSLAAVTEAMYVLDASLPRKNLLTWIARDGLTLVEPPADDFDRVIQLMEKYADLPMDFTDALLVALCERLEVQHIASVDRDFDLYRYKGRMKFTNVFWGRARAE